MKIEKCRKVQKKVDLFLCFAYNTSMDEKTLDNLSIFELRDLARKVGVFNPTVLKKNELINQIYDIKSGKIKPHISKTKQGRPPKEIGGYDKLVEIFLPNDITELTTKEESIFNKGNDIIEFLITYTIEHFETEEKYQRKINYVSYEQHKRSNY